VLMDDWRHTIANQNGERHGKAVCASPSLVHGFGGS
jgi:hypothetical protein